MMEIDIGKPISYFRSPSMVCHRPIHFRSSSLPPNAGQWGFSNTILS
jgi:hypothetical protein